MKAKVVSGAIANFDDTIEIDKGSDAGIKVDMPVIAGTGLVGTVVQVSADRSVVRLITDTSFQRRRQLGAVQRAWAWPRARAPTTSSTAQVNAGQPVLPGNVLVTQGGPSRCSRRGSRWAPWHRSPTTRPCRPRTSTSTCWRTSTTSPT